MKKEKELEYSRALVPLRNKIYPKLIAGLVIILSIFVLSFCLVACKK